MFLEGADDSYICIYVNDKLAGRLFNLIEYIKEVGVELTNELFISEIMYSDYEYVVLSMIIAQEIMNMASLFYVSKILRVQIC